jgi:hypothetical protein
VPGSSATSHFQVRPFAEADESKTRRLYRRLRDDPRRRGRSVAAAEAPRDDHEPRQRCDPGQREEDDLLLERTLVPAVRPALRHVVEAVDDVP